MACPPRLGSCLWLAVVLGGLASCSKQEEAVPRSRTDLHKDELALQAVYLTEKTHKRIIAPMSQGLFSIDPESGEVMWPAYCCTNPDCPGRQEGEPLLFIEPDTKLLQEARPPGTNISCLCPRCLAKRNLATESKEVRQQYINWVRPYVLPETAEKMKQIEAERKRRIAFERTLRKAPQREKSSSPASSGGPQPTRADPSTRP